MLLLFNNIFLMPNYHRKVFFGSKGYTIYSAARRAQAITKKILAQSGVLLADESIVFGAKDAAKSMYFKNRCELDIFREIEYEAVLNRPRIIYKSAQEYQKEASFNRIFDFGFWS